MDYKKTNAPTTTVTVLRLPASFRNGELFFFFRSGFPDPYLRIAQALFLLSRICLIIRLPPYLLSSNRIVRRYVAGAKVFTRSSRTYKVKPCDLAKNLPCALRLRGIFRQNLVRPNLYTEKPLKRNDRYDRKTHKKNVG